MRDIKFKHTQGPWKWSFESIDPEWAIVTNKYGHVIANVNADSRQEANTRIISSAPEMLEALISVLPIMEAVRLKEKIHPTQEVWEKINTAIEKATGLTWEEIK